MPVRHATGDLDPVAGWASFDALPKQHPPFGTTEHASQRQIGAFATGILTR